MEYKQVIIKSYIHYGLLSSHFAYLNFVRIVAKFMCISCIALPCDWVRNKTRCVCVDYCQFCHSDDTNLKIIAEMRISTDSHSRFPSPTERKTNKKKRSHHLALLTDIFLFNAIIFGDKLESALRTVCVQWMPLNSTLWQMWNTMLYVEGNDTDEKKEQIV